MAICSTVCWLMIWLPAAICFSSLLEILTRFLVDILNFTLAYPNVACTSCPVVVYVYITLRLFLRGRHVSYIMTSYPRLVGCNSSKRLFEGNKTKTIYESLLSHVHPYQSKKTPETVGRGGYGWFHLAKPFADGASTNRKNMDPE